MRRVILESPFGHPNPDVIARNLRYLRACMADALRRGEAPFASHGLYTQPGVLSDEDPDDRQAGIDAGLAWGDVAVATVVYCDLGISRGMQYGIAHAEAAGRPVEYRELGPGWAADAWSREATEAHGLGWHFQH